MNNYFEMDGEQYYMSQEIKRLLLLFLIFSVFIISSYIKNNKVEEVYINNNENEVNTAEIKIYTKDVIAVKIYEYATELFNDKKYTSFTVINDMYTLPLNDLINNYNYDFTKLLKTEDTNLSLNVSKSYVVYDVNNVRNLEYKEYPIIINLYWE